MTPDGILETVLYAKDLAAIEGFYRDVLGMEPFTQRGGTASVLSLRRSRPRAGAADLQSDRHQRAAGVGGSLPVPPHGMEGEGHVCFRASAAELEAWRRRLTEMSVAIEADFEWPAGGRSIYFRDPAGNCLEFAEPRIWGLE